MKTYYALEIFSAPFNKISTLTSPRSRPSFIPSLRICSITSPPRSIATARSFLVVFLRLDSLTSDPPMLSVLNRLPLPTEFATERRGLGSEGAKVKSARSCISVSRMRAVISCECNSAFVKIFGGGNLRNRNQFPMLLDWEVCVRKFSNGC